MRKFLAGAMALEAANYGHSNISLEEEAQMVSDASAAIPEIANDLVEVDGVVERSEGLEDLAVIALKSFPNPFHSSFFVSLLAPERQLFSIQVVNVLGKPVYQTEGETGHLYEIPGAEFPEGMYIIRVHTDTGTFNGKVIKVR